MSGLTPFYIQSSRMSIRRFLLGEIDDFLAIRNDPYNARYLPWLPPLSPNDGWAFMTRQAVIAPGRPGVEGHFAIVEQQTSTLIGVCFIKVDASGREAEVGVSVHSRWADRGYEQEALRLLAGWVKDAPNGPRVGSVMSKLDGRDAKMLTAYAAAGFVVASQHVFAGQFPYYLMSA